MTDIANRLKLLRISLNLKQKEFGDIFGYSGQQISNYETGMRKIPDRFRDRLIEKYGENFGLPATPYKQTPEKVINLRSYGLPDLKFTGVGKLTVEISPQEMILLKSIRQLDTHYVRGLLITLMGQLNNLVQEKHIKRDKQKREFLRNCIRELSRIIYEDE